MYELQEVVRAQQDFIARLERGRVDPKRDVALQQRMLEIVRGLAQKSGGAPHRNPRDAFWRAHGAADVFDIQVRRSHRSDLVGRLVTSSKQAFVRGLKPLHLELLRPQRVFNQQFLRFAEQLLEPTALTERSVLASMARQTLSAVDEPANWSVSSHRGALVGRSIDAVKRVWLSTVEAMVAPVLDRQRAWNKQATRAMTMALSVDPMPLGEIHLLLGELAELGRLPIPAELSGSSRASFALWVDLFRRQEHFNSAITEFFTALFDLPRPADDGRLASYPINVASQEQERIAWVARQMAKLGDADRPLVSIIVPTYQTPEAVLRSCLDSVLAQSYSNWELCIVDDGSKSPDVRYVVESYMRRDPRIRARFCFANRGIAAATNEALGLATGSYVAFLDHDDELMPHALGEVVLHLKENPDTDFLYTDEDRLDLRGRRMLPFFKPDWSPDLLRACNYVCHFLVARRSLVDAVGRIRIGFDGAQDYDLVLRMSERAKRIGHVPRVVYHWRATPQSTAHNVMVKPRASLSGVRALQEHLERCGEPGKIETPIPTNYRVRYTIAKPPRVSLLIAAEAHVEGECQRLVDSIESCTNYPDLELVVCHAGTTAPRSRLPMRTVAIERSTRAAQAFQLAARVAQGEVFVLLGADLRAVDRNWANELVGHALRPGVGAVGPKLIYPDGTISHAGLVVGGLARPVSPFAHMADNNEWTTMGSPNWTRNYLAVSGACMATRRSTWETVGGFDGSLGLIEAAVDFCLRVRQRGWQIVYTPHTKLVQTGLPVTELEGQLQRPPVDVDPYYNPNLSTRLTNGRLRSTVASDG